MGEVNFGVVVGVGLLAAYVATWWMLHRLDGRMLSRVERDVKALIGRERELRAERDGLKAQLDEMFQALKAEELARLKAEGDREALRRRVAELDAEVDRSIGETIEATARAVEAERQRDEARECCHAIRRAMQGEGDIPLPRPLTRALIGAMVLSAGLDEQGEDEPAASDACPLCGEHGRRLTSLGVCSWCDNTQGETPDPESELGRFLAGQKPAEEAGGE